MYIGRRNLILINRISCRRSWVFRMVFSGKRLWVKLRYRSIGVAAHEYKLLGARTAHFRTYRTEREISGNNGPKISVSLFCPGNDPPFQPISGAQPGRTRERRTPPASR